MPAQPPYQAKVCLLSHAGYQGGIGLQGRHVEDT